VAGVVNRRITLCIEVVVAKLWLVHVIALFVMRVASAAPIPKFEDYPAAHVSIGKPAKARIATTEQRYWAEWIVSGKPNFAGHTE
jgi:hypothetical protein